MRQAYLHDIGILQALYALSALIGAIRNSPSRFAPFAPFIPLLRASGAHELLELGCGTGNDAARLAADRIGCQRPLRLGERFLTRRLGELDPFPPLNPCPRAAGR